MARYGIYFQKQGETAYLLPVNPETLPVARTAENGEYNIVGVGPIMIPRLPNQRKVTIESFFPGRPFSGMLQGQRGFVPPADYIRFFADIMKNRERIVYQPVRYYENGEAFSGGDVEGFECLVTEFNTEERGGETGDFYYTLEITEYRDYSPQELRLQKTASSAAIVVTPEPIRAVPEGEIVVGSICTCNGRYYSTSYQNSPYGNGNGRRVKVSRIVDKSRKCPYHVTTENGAPLGWTAKENLKAVQ